ncbi:clc channel [Zopfochytrium polystomum]|nr:clc channel [Zopfochytrium polystomum]
MLGAIGSSRRSRLYDEADDETLYREGNGLRVWYNDYTTIDWVHDYVKERVRIRKVRSVGGWRGWWTAKMDSMQAYVLIAIIGECISAGTISSLVSITQLWLTDVKTGYCADGLFLRKKYCCPAAPPTLPIALLINGGDAASFLLRNGTTPDTPCDAWIPWEVAAGATATTRVLGIPAAQLVFMLGSATLALAAVLVVSLSATPSNGRYSDAAAAGVGGVKADVGGGAAGKKAKIVYHAAGSGVPQVKTILGGFVIRGFLGLRTMVVKSIALTLAVASGLCMGQQGPLVHISCCVGNVASRLFEKYATNEAKRREMMSAAAAAGVSVAFGAPIGGVLFSLEEVSYYFPSKTMWRSFICALVAAVTLKLINPFGRGKLVTYQVSYDHDWSGFELFPFLLIGLVGGAYGGWFVKASAQWAQMRQHFGAQKHPISEVLVISLLTAFLSYGSVLTRISNNELIGNLFSECNGDEDLRGLCRFVNMTLTDMMGTLCGILVLKIFLTFITLGIRVPSGVFGLSMVVGACGGRIVGMVMDNLQKNNPEHWLFRGCPADRDCIIPGVYAMVGAAAVLSGVTRMTVSLVVIMVELTGALTYVIPIMCAIMVAKWIADFIEPKSIYESQIRRNGYPYLDHKHEYHVKRRSRREGGRGTAGVVAVDVAERPSRRRADRGAREDGGFAVLYGHILVGYIAFNELNHAYNQIMKSQNINCRFYFRRPDGTDLDDLDLVVGGGGDGDDAVSDNAEEVDLTAFMDQAPLSVRSHTSMELVVELFIKLGVKTLCVVEDDGTFAGFIHKKRLIGWLLDEDLS